MNILAQPAPEWKTEYQQRAEQTQARRRAAGRYARPTKAQEAAFTKLLGRGGYSDLTAAECELLAAHPYLTAGQREQYRLLAIERAEPVVALADDDWIVAIVAQIEALPETLADVADPYQVGWLDAEKGEACDATVHYAKLAQIEMYICGWKDATAAIERA